MKSHHMPTSTMGERLEYQRLAHRARRMQMVLAALEDRALHRHGGAHGTPPPLRHAIRDFRGELGAVRRQMAELRRRGLRT
jgi:hypothetical protein